MVQQSQPTNRYQLVDFIRGFFITAMLIEHFGIVVALTGRIQPIIAFSQSESEGLLSEVLRNLAFAFVRWTDMLVCTPYSRTLWISSCDINVTGSSIFLVVGMSLSLAHARGFKGRKFAIRLGQIGIAALLISIATYLYYPQNWIYFGTLHLIFFASIIALPFVPYPNIALVTGLVLYILYHLGINDQNYFWSLFSNLPKSPLDLFTLLPWSIMVFIGVWLGSRHFWRSWQIPDSKVTRTILFIGKHSLIIYLLHQPVYIAFLTILDQLGKL